MKVFVYGTLKGRVNGEFIGTARTQDDMIVFTGGFPVAARASDVPDVFKQQGVDQSLVDMTLAAPLSGEVYEVDEQELARLDSYEGAPSFYLGEDTVVKLSDGTEDTVLMYHSKSALRGISSRHQLSPSDGVLTWASPSF